MKTSIVACFLAELIETHMANCAAENPNDDVPHIIDSESKTNANIDKLAVVPLGEFITVLNLELSDGSTLNLTVTEE